MPTRACPGCGRSMPMTGPATCDVCRGGAPAHQQRGYRGSAAYREFRAMILDRDMGICARCRQPGADTLGHRRAYSTLDPATRDDVSTWDPADFQAEHDRCNKLAGVHP